MSLFSLNVISANAVTDGDYNCLVGGTPTGTFTIESNEVKRSTNDCAGVVNIPNGVEKIAALAFYEHDRITSVTIPNTVTEIGNSAFENTRLVSLTIPDSVRIIGDNAFLYTKITSLDLGEGVEQIGNYSFGGINDGINHLDVVIPDSVTTLSENAFGQSNLGHVVIGDGLEIIESAVFYNNYGEGARSIVFGSNITEIRYGAFLGINATQIVLPESLRQLGPVAFGYTNLSYFYIPENLTSLSDDTFKEGGSDVSTVSKAVYCGRNASIINFDYPGSTTSTCEQIVNFNSNLPPQRESYQSSTSDGTLNTNTFLRDGYTFSHWSTQKNGSGIRYEDGQSFNFLSNLKLYAQWISNSSGGNGGQESENTWVGRQSISCPESNPWDDERLLFASNVQPVLVSAENSIGKTITQGSYDSLKSSGVVFDTVSTKVSTATETLPIYGCKDKLLNGKVNQPIQFIAGGYTLQSDAHGYINTADLKWHDTNSVTLYTNTAAFMHTIKFTNPGRYVVVLTEQPDTSRGLIPTYGVRSVRFVININ